MGSGISFKKVHRFRRTDGLFGPFYRIRAVLFIGAFGFQIVNVFQRRSKILCHIKGFPASGPGGADENNCFICRKSSDFLFQFTHGDVDRCFKMTHGVFVRITNIDDHDAVRSGFEGFFKGRNVNASFFFALLDRHGFGGYPGKFLIGRVAGGKDFNI